MLYSGASLVRANSQQQERFDNLRATEPVRPVDSAKQKEAGLDEDTRGALLRFARFIHKEKQESPKKPPQAKPVSTGAHPYERTWAAVEKAETNGQILDIYA